MHCPADYGLVQINVAVPNLYIEATIRIGANPRLIVDGCSLTAEVREGHKVALFAFLTLGERDRIQVTTSQPKYWGIV